MKHTVLIVEDEKEISNAIAIYLNNQGYDVLQAENGQVGLDMLKENEVSLAIVDVMMPVMDGVTMIMKARESYDLPIIVLSAKSEDIDKITGLNIGADDYVTKPFVPMELIARVQAQIRRYYRYQKQEIQKFHGYQVGGLELHTDTKNFYVDGDLVRLTPLEMQIMELFMKHPNVVFSSEQIYESIWKEEAISTETVMVHIRNLREKIEINPKEPRYIKVIWGIGYKLEK
ncbi:DNA-binding response regulator [Erysipelotrichaceae bacterium MTC7]|nr:DNA-binding response regulator [Erysipelotrichaceae bacterium MTC7]